MNILIIIILMIFQNFDRSLEGKWKLTEFTGFTSVLGSHGFNNLTEDQKLKGIQSMEFTLENTYYIFKEDSIFFTNAGGDFSITEKKGKYLIKSDTLFVFESEKINVIKFFITSLNEKELKMKFVRKGGVLGPTEMTFSRIY